MKFTHQELLQAVREIAEGREFFTSADVRKHLGVSTRDRSKLSQFHQSFRSFHKAAVEDVENLGDHRYRLRERAHSEAVCASAPAVEATSEVALVMNAVEAPIAPVAEIRSELVLPSFTPPARRVTRLHSARRWRERAQRLGRRVAQLFQGIGLVARAAGWRVHAR